MFFNCTYPKRKQYTFTIRILNTHEMECEHTGYQKPPTSLSRHYILIAVSWEKLMSRLEQLAKASRKHDAKGKVET